MITSARDDIAGQHRRLAERCGKLAQTSSTLDRAVAALTTGGGRGADHPPGTTLRLEV